MKVVIKCGGMASGARAFRHRKAKSSGSQEVSKTTSLGTNQGQGQTVLVYQIGTVSGTCGYEVMRRIR